MTSNSQLDNRKRRRLLVRELTGAVTPFGFSHQRGPYFVRERNGLVDAFFFQLTRTNNQFVIAYGVDAPDHSVNWNWHIANTALTSRVVAKEWGRRCVREAGAGGVT